MNEQAAMIAEIIKSDLRLVGHPNGLCEECSEPIVWKVKDGCIEAIAVKIAAAITRA